MIEQMKYGEKFLLKSQNYEKYYKERFKKIKVNAQDLDGNPIEFHAEDRFARVIQHEIDHLYGKLFIDRISSLKRNLYKKKLKKILKSRS